MHFELWKSKHSSPQIEIQLQHKQIKSTSTGFHLLSDQTISPLSIQVPDLEILAVSDSCQAFLLSNLSDLDSDLLLPGEKNQLAAGLARFSDRKLTKRIRRRYPRVSVLVEIEVKETVTGIESEEISEMINREKEKPLRPEEGAGNMGTCAICLEVMEIGAAAAPLNKLLPCRHLFHESCIFTWCSKRDSCPLCRSDIVVGYSIITD